MDEVLIILLAGGKGTRLEPLTRDRAKPAVPFAGMYRIIDFSLSNCINSRQFNILVLTQYKSLSLERHIAQGWDKFFHPEFGQRLTVASPQQRVSDDWYLGTADAVFQNLYSVERSGATYVVVLAGDHVYKMDFRQILAFHQNHGGVATVATLPVLVDDAAGQFGVVRVDSAGRIVSFEEKPPHPTPLPGNEGYCLASMGIYVFTAKFLVDELQRDAHAVAPGRDFGSHTLPKIVGRSDVHAFIFSGFRACWENTYLCV
jgi:glucose-1-phosphate adenylyltransferase